MAKNQKTILIVDDEPIIGESIAIVLESKGRRFAHAIGGNMAFEMIESEQIDLVITDLKMPDGDGLELLKKIRIKDSKVPPVVLMTGYPVLSENQTQNRGASALITKPMDYEKLKELINKLL